jgi:glyoxylase-like metal-dependent hydrolase (beta-lactamase superfamily II)
LQSVQEIRKGVWHWQAPHPEWEDGHGWDRVVSSYAIEHVDQLLIFDPLAAPDRLHGLTAGREVSIILTSPWHVRDAVGLAKQLEAPLYVPPPDEADPDPLRAHIYEAGQTLPGGVEAHPGMEPNDLMLWIPSHRALVMGDTVIDRGDGLIFPLDWATRIGDPPAILASLQQLLELPVELVLPTHGPPTDAAALRRAIQNQG